VHLHGRIVCMAGSCPWVICAGVWGCGKGKLPSTTGSSSFAPRRACSALRIRQR
jgi:hypothetical protein